MAPLPGCGVKWCPNHSLSVGWQRPLACTSRPSATTSDAVYCGNLLGPLNGIRRYAAADVSRLRFIKHAQESGFSLDEVNALLGLSGRPACRASRAVAAKKLEELSGDSQTAIPRSTALSPPVLPISCWYPFLVVVNGVVPTYNSMLSCRSPVNFQRNLGQLGRC